mgnify:CR=1 FL=1
MDKQNNQQKIIRISEELFLHDPEMFDYEFLAAVDFVKDMEIIFQLENKN